MDESSSRWTNEQIRELWNANFNTAVAALNPREIPRLLETTQRIHRRTRKAMALADAQTKRQVRDPQAWQRFTNHRARTSRRTRPQHKYVLGDDDYEPKNPRSTRRQGLDP